MSSELTPDERSRAARALKTRMVVNALYHLQALDARTAAVMRKNGLSVTAQGGDLEDAGNTAEVVADPAHPQRLLQVMGPMVFHRDETKECRQLVVEVPDMLLAPEQPWRAAAITHIDRLLDLPNPPLTPRTRDTVSANREELLSHDPTRWTSAAATVFDTINDDWLCSLAGVRQGLEAGYDGGVGKYLHRVLFPEVSSIDSIDLVWWEPRGQKAAIEATVLQIVDESGDLSQALDRYYRALGHMPLAPEVGMSRLVVEWEIRKSRGKSLWEAVWTWADKASSPLARYHACQVLLNVPEHVPAGGAQRLWEEVTAAVYLPAERLPEGRWSEAWHVRCELARHFCQHLECRLPGKDGERIALMAWWMAERVAQLFDASPEVLRRARETAISPAAEISSHVWLFTHPIVQPSGLRYGTLFMHSVWALSLMSQLGAKLGDLSPGEMGDDAREHLTTGLGRALLDAFPLRPRTGTEAVYAFDQHLIPSAQAWLEGAAPPSLRESFEACIRAALQIAQPAELGALLQDLPKRNEADQWFIAQGLRAMAHAREAPVDAIWEALQDDTWREDLLLQIAPRAIEPFLEALTEIQVSQGGQWASHLPHYFALACESASEDRARRQLLFALTVLVCLRTDTVSAIQRLLRGKQRHQYEEEVASWRERLDEIRHAAPPWMAARLRAILASLHVS